DRTTFLKLPGWFNIFVHSCFLIDFCKSISIKLNVALFAAKSNQSHTNNIMLNPWLIMTTRHNTG
ncbi:MAG: hypothetical protein KAQ79_10975, partial [Cyclobacteriaceae bacterium]|nr:hypothetical protein [Cyclobacteriaceae bacterium]